jgi:hypothetical protein
MDEAEQDLMLGESFKVPGQACSVGIFQFCLSYRLLSYALESIIVFWSLDLHGGKVFFFWSNCRWRIFPCLSPLQVVKKVYLSVSIVVLCRYEDSNILGLLLG